MFGITLITATSDRPAGIALTKRWLSSQRVQQPTCVQWLICDDGRQPADVALDSHVFSENRLVVQTEHVRIPPARSVPLSFRGNVCAGIVRARHPLIAFWEDDDFYPSHWLQWISDWFQKGYELIGEGHARYYNVQTRRYRTLRNHIHASLCQTAVSSRMAQWLDNRCRTQGGTYIDMDVWKQGPACRRILQQHSTVIGIKGLPGKPGIGIGHKLPDTNPHDADGSILRQWVGPEAAALYAGFAADQQREAA